jgi:hypothetical protein
MMMHGLTNPKKKSCLTFDLLQNVYIDVASEARSPVHRHTAVRKDTHETKQNTTRPLLGLPVTSHDHADRESRQMFSFIAAHVGGSAGLIFITRHVQQASRTPLHFQFSASYFIAILSVHRTLQCLWPFNDNIACTDIFCALKPTGMLTVDHYTSIFAVYVRQDAA